MNKKDIIIVAALLNAATLAILFMMAVRVDDQAVIHPSEIIVTPTAMPEPIAPDISSWSMADAKIYSTDEVDDILREFDAIAADDVMPDIPHTTTLAKVDERKITHDHSPPIAGESQQRLVDIVVKKGDILDRIARANGTTVSEIKRLNQLKNERLSIGQVLKVPVGTAKVDAEPTPKPKPETLASKATTAPKNAPTQPGAAEPAYYIVKSGDSPWKISKQMNIKMEDLLELNNLDEEKARNLKIGDKIRIR
jgi:peptidoglycan endopeptidase LytF